MRLIRRNKNRGLERLHTVGRASRKGGKFHMRLIRRSGKVWRTLPTESGASVKMLTKKSHPSLELAGTLELWWGL